MLLGTQTVREGSGWTRPVCAGRAEPGVVTRSDKGAWTTPPGHLPVQKLVWPLETIMATMGNGGPEEAVTCSRPWGADVRAPPESAPRPAPHLPREQLGLRRPGALDLVAHAVEEGDAILVLIVTKELRQDLSSFL